MIPQTDTPSYTATCERCDVTARLSPELPQASEEMSRFLGQHADCGQMSITLIQPGAGE